MGALVTTLYQKGETLGGGSGECVGAAIIKSGGLRAYIMSEQGKEITLYRLNPGDICILNSSRILNAPSFDAFFEAEEDTLCLTLNESVFSEIARRNVHAQNYILKIVSQRLSDSMWLMQQILFTSLDCRLARFLYDEMIKGDTFYISTTHEQIAKHLGSAREVVSRMLKYFASEGIVTISRGGIRIIDANKLRELT